MTLRLVKDGDSSSDQGTISDYEHYERFFNATLGSIKKDIFSGELLVKGDTGWESVKSYLRILRSYAQDTDGLIKPQRIEDHLARYAKKFNSQLLIDIPVFSSERDYLREICNCIHPTNVTQDELYELLLEWGANMWRRFENPTHQNKVLILQSAQGVGKDFLLRALFGGLEQFFINFTVSHNERENLSVLNQALIINISEFDRTSRLNTGLLKDMITRDSTFVRLPFDKCALKRAVRCSFVGSCNTRNILTDTTGNRRYVIIEIDKIDRSYPVDQSLNVLAKFKAAASAGYEASKSTIEKMNGYIHSITPKDTKERLLSDFDAAIELLETASEHSAGIFQRSDIESIVSELKADFKISEKRILGTLGDSGRSHRTSNGMIYGRPDLALRYREFQRMKGM